MPNEKVVFFQNFNLVLAFLLTSVSNYGLTCSPRWVLEATYRLIGSPLLYSHYITFNFLLLIAFSFTSIIVCLISANTCLSLHYSHFSMHNLILALHLIINKADMRNKVKSVFCIGHYFVFSDKDELL